MYLNPRTHFPAEAKSSDCQTTVNAPREQVFQRHDWYWTRLTPGRNSRRIASCGIRTSFVELLTGEYGVADPRRQLLICPHFFY
jgi:hypothetical protein